MRNEDLLGSCSRTIPDPEHPARERPEVPTLLFLACFIIGPAILTWGLVRLVLARDPSSSRARILRICVPLGAVLPLLPGTVMVALSSQIYNSVFIAIIATTMAAMVTSLCVCLPVGLSLTRHLAR